MKRQMEVKSISRAAPAHAEMVCDFGCGLGRNPDDPEFRIHPVQDEFDRITEETAIQRDVLSVRAFTIHVPEDCDRSSIPLVLDELPIAFNLSITDFFRSTTTIYSVHAWCQILHI